MNQALQEAVNHAESGQVVRPVNEGEQATTLLQPTDQKPKLNEQPITEADKQVDYIEAPNEAVNDIQTLIETDNNKEIENAVDPAAEKTEW